MSSSVAGLRATSISRNLANRGATRPCSRSRRSFIANAPPDRALPRCFNRDAISSSRFGICCGSAASISMKSASASAVRSGAKRQPSSRKASAARSITEIRRAYREVHILPHGAAVGTKLFTNDNPSVSSLDCALPSLSLTKSEVQSKIGTCFRTCHDSALQSKIGTCFRTCHDSANRERAPRERQLIGCIAPLALSCRWTSVMLRTLMTI